MKDDKVNPNSAPDGTTNSEANPELNFDCQEKASIGGSYNSGVTSSDPDEKMEIEKQASMGNKQPLSAQEKVDNQANNDIAPKNSD